MFSIWYEKGVSNLLSNFWNISYLQLICVGSSWSPAISIRKHMTFSIITIASHTTLNLVFFFPFSFQSYESSKFIFQVFLQLFNLCFWGRKRLSLEMASKCLTYNGPHWQDESRFRWNPNILASCCTLGMKWSKHVDLQEESLQAEASASKFWRKMQ